MQKQAQPVTSAPKPAVPIVAPAVFCLTGIDRKAARARFGELTKLKILERFTPAALTAVAERGEKAVVVYSEAEQHLIAAMDAGRAPGPALERWSTEISEVLQVRRRWRRQVVLIRHLHLMEGKPDELQPLHDLLGHPLGGEPASSEILGKEALYLVLARQLLAASPAAQALANELDASSLPWSGTVATPDINAIYRDWQDRLARQTEQASQSIEVAKQLNLMRNQVLLSQEELGQRLVLVGENEKSARESAAESAQAALDAEARISALSAKLREYDNKNEVLRLEVERLVSELRHGKERESLLQRHASALDEEREAIFQSHSWKLTRPLRALKEMFDRPNSKKIV